MSLALGVACAALGFACAPTAAADTGSTAPTGQTYQVFVGKTLVTSSADPTQHTQAPTYVATVGKAVSVSVTYVTNFPITLETRTIYDDAVTAVPEVPQGVTATVTGADCTPPKSGENTVLQCATLPAGSHTVNFTYLVSPGSAFLKEPTQNGSLYITQTAIPQETAAQLEAGVDFSVLVEPPASATAGSPAPGAPTSTATATSTATQTGTPITPPPPPPAGAQHQGPADVAPLVAAAVANSGATSAASPSAGPSVLADPPDIFTSGTEPAAAATAGVILLLALGGSLVWRRRVYAPEAEVEAAAAAGGPDTDGTAAADGSASED
jgi:MYXO-CTERM domain-containing protein